MQGEKKVLQYLSKVLTNELTAVNQYFPHAPMFRNWRSNISMITSSRSPSMG